MKKLQKFPVSFVRNTLPDGYRKSFHTQVFTLFASCEAFANTLAKRATPHYTWIYVFTKEENGDLYLSTKELEKVKKWVLKGAHKTDSHIGTLYGTWKKDWTEFQRRSKRLFTTDLMKLIDEKLLQEFAGFYDNYLRAGSFGYLADCFMSTGELDWLEELVPERIILTFPYQSLVRKSELELAVIARKKLPEKSPVLRTLLKKHMERYFWINNNYAMVEELDEDSFARQLKKIDLAEIERQEKERQTELSKRSKLFKNLALSLYIKNVLTIAELFTKWKDLRKSSVQVGMHFFDKFLTEIARRKRLNKKDLGFLVFYEVMEFLQGNQKILDLIPDRKQQSFYAVTPHGYFVTGGIKANPYFTKLKVEVNENLKVLKGVGASPGKVQGKIYLVINNDDMKNFPAGAILVTNQTTPEFVPIMKRAAAIITEQGGITSHAAVISRELHKPCIIGTKIATKVFETGDKVEVDAAKGMVRKI